MQEFGRPARAGGFGAWWWTLGMLAVVLLWDATGFDVAAARLFGDAGGFALRGNPVIFYGLHEAPRILGWFLVAGLFVSIGWPFGVLKQLGRAERAWLAVTVLLSVLAVSMVKATSQTSCPWDLREFGGSVPYVPHWLLAIKDGGTGRCFPAGHASAAFAWVAGWFAFRGRNDAVARAWLITAVVAGLVLGIAQQARGAHFFSHTLWTAFICWTVALASDTLFRAVRAGRSTTVLSSPAQAVDEGIHGNV